MAGARWAHMGLRGQGSAASPLTRQPCLPQRLCLSVRPLQFQQRGRCEGQPLTEMEQGVRGVILRYKALQKPGLSFGSVADPFTAYDYTSETVGAAPAGGHCPAGLSELRDGSQLLGPLSVAEKPSFSLSF